MRKQKEGANENEKRYKADHGPGRVAMRVREYVCIVSVTERVSCLMNSMRVCVCCFLFGIQRQ